MAVELNVVLVTVTAPFTGSVRLPQSTSVTEFIHDDSESKCLTSPSSQLWPVVPSGQTHILSELDMKGLGHCSTHTELL